MTLKFAKSGLDLISISRVTSCCNEWPRVIWPTLYICCCQLGELCDAEDALTEANVLNNLEPEVWAYLCLLCLDTERHVEAEQAYKYMRKVQLITCI